LPWISEMMASRVMSDQVLSVNAETAATLLSVVRGAPMIVTESRPTIFFAASVGQRLPVLSVCRAAGSQAFNM
jgi:hypothetical protein